MIFGRGGGGGILNRVLKRPGFTDYRSLTGSGDGFGGFRLTGDLDQPFGGGFGARVNAMYEDGDSFRHHVGLKRYGINPTAALQVGPARGSTCRTNISMIAAPPTAGFRQTATNRCAASAPPSSATRASVFPKRT